MKKVKVGFIILVSILLLSYVSYAADASILKVSYNKSGKPGSNATLNVLLQNTGNFQSAITSIEGYLNFDKNVFEKVTVNSIESNNGKVQIGNNNNLDLADLSNFSISNALSQFSEDAGFYFNGNPISGNDCKIVIDFDRPIAEDTKLFTINLTVKSNAEPKEYANAIEISGFKAYFEDNTITSIDTAKLGFVVQGETNPPDNPTNNVVNNSTVDNNAISNNTINNNTINNNTINNNSTYDDTDNNTVNNTTNDIDDNKTNTDNKVDNNAVNNATDNKTNNIVDNGTKNGSKSNSNNAINNNSTGGKTEDKTIADKILPYTGIKGILIPLLLLSVFAFVIYKKYNKEIID